MSDDIIEIVTMTTIDAVGPVRVEARHAHFWQLGSPSRAVS
jgi:hypothetical protein